MERQYCVYILTNKNNSVLYTGVTGNLLQRIDQHKAKLSESFTKKKIELIDALNPGWKDLSEESL